MKRRLKLNPEQAAAIIRDLKAGAHALLALNQPHLADYVTAEANKLAKDQPPEH